MSRLFSAGVETGYAELPVKSNYGFWKRGDGTLRAVAETDPAKFFGGWHFMVEKQDDSGNVIPYPQVPLPLIERYSDSGDLYKRYSWNFIDFMPLRSRIRYELRDKDNGKVLASTNTYVKDSGYQPSQQVFGLAFADDGTWTPVVIKLDKWNSYISFQSAERDALKVAVPEGQELIRRFGNIGETKLVKQGGVLKEMQVPEFEVYGQSKSTPIRAIGLDNPTFVKVTPEMIALHSASAEWRNCPRWNATHEQAAGSFAGNTEAMQEVMVDQSTPFDGDEEIA